MVAGRRAVSLTIRCENARQDDPEHRYSIHPERLIAAVKLARSRNEEVIGFYHSHPDHSARYSSTDLENAHWFDCSYVIISVERGHASRTLSFVLTGSEEAKSFQDEEIEIISSP